MPWTVAAAAIGAGAAIYSSSQASGASRDASAAQMSMYNQTRSDLQPYNQAGQSALSALMGYWGLSAPSSGGAGTSGGPTPGMIAAQAAGPHSKNGVTDGLGGFLLDGGLGLFRQNSSPIQDIAGALAAGKPVSDASWKMAGYGPGGSALGSTPSMNALNPVAGTGGVLAAQGGGQGGGLNGANAFSMLQNYPGYQFQFGQGLQALNRNLSAGGRYMSGAMMKDAQTFGQGQAESAVQNYLQMLQYLGTLGQNSAAQTGSLGAEAARSAGNFGAQAGQQSGQGIMGAANSLGGLLQNSNFQSLFSGNSSGVGMQGGYAPAGIDPVYITPGVKY